MLPGFNEFGDLPPGVYKESLEGVLARFGVGSSTRQRLASRLERLYDVAASTQEVRRFVLFGSFITEKEHPNDIDVFLVMEDSFDFGGLSGEARILFDHDAAQAHFGASVFWLRSIAALGGEETAIQDWKIKRDGGTRGLVEIEGPRS